MSFKYIISAGILCKRCFTSEYACYLTQNEAQGCIQETHERISRGHLGHHIVLKHIMRSGYYWPIM